MVKKTKDAETVPSLFICKRMEETEENDGLKISCIPFVEIENANEEK